MGLTDLSLHTPRKQRDPRFAERLLSLPEWALKKMGFDYRYLCRVPLCTPHHRLGMRFCPVQ